ncbi:uncharacterized protein LOC128240772 isoform X3 [Mya arenaria]|nr:uncharacterized protein LOC128240772 isoform X3 [Mya arenaria]XP_052813594.1 uncharacterized protein LOC128240772 isoform X3 [Mya arenaria]
MADSTSSILVGLVEKLDIRLQSIESKLDPIQNELLSLKTEVAKVRDENLNITSKVTEMETFRQSISDFIDDCNRNTQKCSNSVDDLQIHCAGMSKLLNTIQSDNEAYKEEILDLKWRSMRENLIFVGIPENYNTIQNTDEHSMNAQQMNKHEQTLRQFLVKHVQNDTSVNKDSMINVQNIRFDRVHRSGGPSRLGKPRPIIAKFERFSDRESVREAGVRLNMKKSGFYINEQFPPEMEERRRELYGVMRRYKADPLVADKCKLVRDKLYVGNKVYDPVTSTLIFPKPKYSRSQQYQPPARSFVHERPRTGNIQTLESHPVRLDFSTPNRFNVLTNLDPEQTLVRNRPAQRSPPTPLDETILKRPRDDTSTPVGPDPLSMANPEENVQTAGVCV